jgi:4-hydroxy-tetrahydrodipicolinate synthase
MTQATGQRKLAGVIPALITPVADSGAVDFGLLEKQVLYLSSAGVNGFFIAGTTGEGPYLPAEEKIDLFKHVKEVSDGKQFLCMACLQASTEQVLAEIERVSHLAPDFIVAVAPYYFAASQGAVLDHFGQIAAASPSPVIIYNIPQHTHNLIELETVLKLAETDNIAGIKDSTGNFIQLSRGLLSKAPQGFSWIQGEDYLDAPALLLGGHGLVTGLGNVWIEPYVKMYQACLAGNTTEVIANQKAINELYEVIRVTAKGIAAIKAATGFLGRGLPRMKMASLSLNGKELKKVKRVLSDLGLM